MVSVLALAIAAGLLLWYLAGSRARLPALQHRSDKTLQRISEIVDESLKRYKDRHVTRFEETVNWGCSSRLFSFDISLQRIGRKYTLSVYLRRQLQYDFRLKPPGNVNNDPKLKAILDTPDIRTLADRLSFFDWVVVHKGGITARKDVTPDFDSTAWKAALSASLTFLRYLIHTETMAQASGTAGACPYCKGEIKPGEPIVSCTTCRTIHHKECWLEIDCCSVFGCSNKTEMSL